MASRNLGFFNHPFGSVLLGSGRMALGDCVCDLLAPADVRDPGVSCDLCRRAVVPEEKDFYAINKSFFGSCFFSFMAYRNAVSSLA